MARGGIWTEYHMNTSLVASAAQSEGDATPASRGCTVGVVSFLNARPLIEGLAQRPGWTLRPAVPSALAAMLDEGMIDVGLLPVVDFHRRRDRLRLISDACIASDGETLTVRVFSRCPAEQIERLHVDPDSHTSVILARLIWHEMYGRRPALCAWRSAGTVADVGPREAVLLIGDKVVTRRPRGFGFEVDLGAAWKHLTGLPMVFAAWACRSDCFDAPRHAAIALALSRARDEGLSRASEIAEREAAEHGWPVDLARHYLTESLQYRLTPHAMAGMERFLNSAADAGLLRDGDSAIDA